jgi:hypothetical protein
MVSVDTQPPVVRMATVGAQVLARIHDHKSPTHLEDYKTVTAKFSDGSTAAMQWYGEYLWRAPVPTGATVTDVCAVDRQNNTGCANGNPNGAELGDVPDAGVSVCVSSHCGGGCCDTGGSPSASLVPLLVALTALRRRATRSAAS